MKKYITALLVLLLVSCALPGAVHAATISLEPVQGSYHVGDEVPLKIYIDSSSPSTTIETQLQYDANAFTVEQVTPNKRVFPYWWSQAVNAKQGIVSLVASVPTPGVSGKQLLATLVLKATQEGNASFSIGEPSHILAANDTDMFDASTVKPALFQVSQAAPSSMFNLLAILLGAAFVGAGALVVTRLTKKRNAAE